jgi:hypothetical protein
VGNGTLSEDRELDGPEPLDSMLTFDAWGIAMLLHHIDETRQHATKMCELDGRDEKLTDEEIKLHVDPVILMAHVRAKEAQLQSTLDRVWDNGPFTMASKVGITYQELRNELTVLRQSIEADLEKRTFAFIPPPKDEFLSNLEADWKPVWTCFPSAKYDSEEAMVCYALELNTACIFHLMRVSEFGLRGLARRMKVSLPKKKPLEWAQWQEILKEMSDKTTAISGTMKAGPAKDALLEFYRGALGQFCGFKDEYRNHVMHTRGVYDESKAASVIAHVRDFMNKLAARIDEKGKTIK